jgi:hypothetical protein
VLDDVLGNNLLFKNGYLGAEEMAQNGRVLTLHVQSLGFNPQYWRERQEERKKERKRKKKEGKKKGRKKGKKKRY